MSERTDIYRRDTSGVGPAPSAGYQFTPATPEAWDGRARMARARQAAGVVLDAVDRQALARVVDDGSATR